MIIMRIIVMIMIIVIIIMIIMMRKKNDIELMNIWSRASIGCNSSFKRKSSTNCNDSRSSNCKSNIVVAAAIAVAALKVAAAPLLLYFNFYTAH